MKLDRITAQEMSIYLPRLEKEYAGQLSENMDIPLEEALLRSHKQVSELLPQGIDTPEHLIFVICEEGQPEPAGYLWVNTDQSKHRAFIYDIEIAEALRGRGLGRAALLKLEELMLEMGVNKIGLHVFGNNPVAQHLYQSLGYEITGMNMQKQLITPPD